MKPEDEQADSGQDIEELPRRLCSEIQLFDLCDLEQCSFRDGRFCTHADLLAQFEAAAEPDDRPVDRYEDDDEDEDDQLYSEEYEEDEYSVFDEEDQLEERLDDEW